MILRKFIFFFGFVIAVAGHAQERTIVLTKDMFDEYGFLPLANLDGWVFSKGNDSVWANPELDTRDWQILRPTELSSELEDSNRMVEGWFRLKIRLGEPLSEEEFHLSRELWAATDIYLNGEKVVSFGNTGENGEPFKVFNPFSALPVPIELESGKEYLLAMHIVNREHTLMLREYKLKPERLQNLINLSGSEYFKWKSNDLKWSTILSVVTTSTTALLMMFFWGLVIQNRKEKIFFLIALLSSIVFIHASVEGFDKIFESSFGIKIILGFLSSFVAGYIVSIDLKIVEKIVGQKVPYLSTSILILFPPVSFIAHTYNQSIPFSIVNTIFLVYFSYLVFRTRKTLAKEQIAVIIGTIANVISIMIGIGLMRFYSTTGSQSIIHILVLIYFLSIPLSLLVYVALRFNGILKEIKKKANELVQLSEEKKQIIADQNVILEKQVDERTKELETSLENLKATQTQLIQSEKMASLGELTAGIAHEIQNPLNFVNNFSEVSAELVEEMEEELEKGDIEEAKAIGGDLKENLSKINHHGKRAGDIVKGMLQHSRTSTGEKELTDINVLADEYLRLAYHGLRAKDKSFNADFKLELDPSLPKVNVIPQDIGRVLLNLINNAFFAVDQKLKAKSKDYKPLVVLSTQKLDKNIEISVQDNGPGIPDEIKDKIFQPFFTTKLTGEGTGLGLSLSYDIITKGHGGILKVQSEPGKGSEFIIILEKV